jgi:AcrR family transcriptional regulator
MPSAPAPRATEDISTRQRILDGALDLFSKFGFAGTSVRQLARAVGLRESSLYNHFASKEAIYHALIDTWGPASSAERLRTSRFQALSDDPAGFCRLYADELLEQWSDLREQRFQDLLRSERGRMASEQSHYFDTLFLEEAGLVSNYFRQFALSGLINAPDPRETARLFMGGLTFVRLEHFLVPPEPSPRRLAREALDRFLDNFLALIAPKTPRRPRRG